jgi:hypothetical protein
VHEAVRVTFGSDLLYCRKTRKSLADAAYYLLISLVVSRMFQHELTLTKETADLVMISLCPSLLQLRILHLYFGIVMARIFILPRA